MVTAYSTVAHVRKGATANTRRVAYLPRPWSCQRLTGRVTLHLSRGSGFKVRFGWFEAMPASTPPTHKGRGPHRNRALSLFARARA